MVFNSGFKGLMAVLLAGEENSPILCVIYVTTPTEEVCELIFIMDVF